MSDPTEFHVMKCRSYMSFYSESDGGLHQPLTLPTQSIVFKFDDGEWAGSGLVAIVAAKGIASVSAGSAIDADVTFPDFPVGEDLHDRAFTLWIGRSIGTARIIALDNG
jgi:hypothetical protein